MLFSKNTTTHKAIYLNIFLIDMVDATFTVQNFFSWSYCVTHKKMSNAGVFFFLKRMTFYLFPSVKATQATRSFVLQKKIVMLRYTDDLERNRGFKVITSIKAVSRIVTLKYWIRKPSEIVELEGAHDHQGDLCYAKSFID